MTASEIIKQIQSEYDGELTEAEATSEIDAWVGVPREHVQQMARFIRDTWRPVHLSTITGVDAGRSIEVIYHFVTEGLSLNLRAVVPKDVDVIDTITSVLPSAILYEREVAEMFGVEITGHPDPRRLVLPDDWPEGDYPLRREDAEDDEEEQEDEEDDG